MGKTWTRIKHDRTFEFGRDVLVQVLIASFYGSAAAILSIMVWLRFAAEPIVIVLVVGVYLMLIRAGEAYRKAQFAHSEWKRWREFLKELDAIKTPDTTFSSHDL